MLSVLIPTYHYNAFPLVNEIYNQLKQAKVDFEIICLDDGSDSDLNLHNQKINELDFCSFSELETNMGRSAIRNLLANKAKYSWLLFLDADVMPKSKDFINKYLQLINENSISVFAGGITYNPDDKNKHLFRFQVGLMNEEIDIKKRNKKPNKYFFSSNFLIRKKIFEKVKFEETLKKYGKEDLLFSLALKSENFKIQHIVNEVYHLGIDSNVIFLEKTKQAMKNLVLLKKSKILSEKESSLLRLGIFFEKIGLGNFFGNLVPYLEKKTLKTNSIFYFKLLKISYLSSFLK